MLNDISPLTPGAPSIPVTPVNLPSQKCLFTTTLGAKTTLYTKGQSLRAHFEHLKKDISITDMLFTNDTFYLWDSVQKKGIAGHLSENNGIIAIYYNNAIKQINPQDCQQMDLLYTTFSVPEDISFNTFNNTQQ